MSFGHGGSDRRHHRVSVRFSYWRSSRSLGVAHLPTTAAAFRVVDTTVAGAKVLPIMAPAAK